MSIPRYAQYGINMVPAQDLAFQRGTGNFNESPNYDQSTDRGPTYSQALNVYSSGQYYNEDQAIRSADEYVNKDFGGPFSFNDNTVKQKYVVGTTGIHPERTDSWSRPDFGDTRGTDQYQVWAINSMQISPNALLNFFFCEENVNYLQDKLISEVKRLRSYDISKQSTDELLIIMRNKYLYAQSGWLGYADPNKVYARGAIDNPNALAYSSGSGGCTDLELQVRKLNQSVLEECVKSVLSGLDMYMTYYKDASSLPVPLSLPVLTSSKGDSVLTPNLAFQSGHEMTKANASFNQRFNII